VLYGDPKKGYDVNVFLNSLGFKPQAIEFGGHLTCHPEQSEGTHLSAMKIW